MISEYERLRLANIERNNRYLLEIGLTGPAALPKPHHPAKARAKTMAKIPSEFIRRSARLAAVDSPPKYKEAVLRSAASKSQVERTETGKADFDDAEEKVPQTKRKSSAGLVREISPGSSRAIDADLRFILGEGLGCHIGENRTKASVMASANRGRVPSFSKYSGVAEWRNCLFLWVNYGDSKNEVLNEFSEEGRRISWYGGSNVYRDSDIIQKLIRYSDITDADPLQSNKCVLMFLRRPDELYISLGRLKYASYDLNTHPIAFVFDLLDFERLKAQAAFSDLLSI